VDFPGVYLNHFGRPYILTAVTGRARQYLLRRTNNNNFHTYIWKQTEPGQTIIGPSDVDLIYSELHSPHANRSPRTNPNELTPNATPQTSPPATTTPLTANMTNQPTAPQNPQFGQGQQTNPPQLEEESVSSSAGTNSFSLLLDPHPLPGCACSPYGARNTGFKRDYKWLNFGDAPSSHPEPPSFCFPNPLPFTDDINNALPYITHVKFYMGINSSRFPHNSKQIYFFTQGCHGSMSRRWASMILAQNMKEREENVGQPKFATLKQVSSNFAIQFAPIERRRTAQANLEVFKQGTMHAHNYVTKFEILAEDAGYKGEALIQSFRQGLAEVIRDKINKMRLTPSTFTEWKEEAIRRNAAF
jgi:hypothetical protein